MQIESFNFFIDELVEGLFVYFGIAGSAFLIFYILLKKPMWFRKTQQKFPKLKDYKRDIIYSLSSLFIFAIISWASLFWLKPYNNMFEDFGAFGWGYTLFTCLWMLIVHDTYFYWMHRFLHIKKLFKYVHVVHHKSTNPSPWTAYAFHPVEAFFEALIVPIIAFTVPVHLYTFGGFFLFQIIYNVYGHLGFELYPKNFHKSFIGKWINTSVAHNQHHSKFRGNYGLYFLFWDRWMGTLRDDYDQLYESTTKPA